MARFAAAVDAMRAVFELARARWWLLRAKPGVIAALASTDSDGSVGPSDPRQIERVRLAILRAHHRVPWRADCLVQALAARRWLATLGIASRLHLGIRSAGAADPAGPAALASMTDGGRFMAHAWLVADGVVVTGGEIVAYARLNPDRQVISVEQEKPGQTSA